MAIAILQCQWRPHCIVTLGQESMEMPKEQSSNTSTVTGAHWTGSPNKSIDQIGKNCPKRSENCVFQPLWTIFRHYSDIFRHFSDILSTFPFSGLSNDLPVTTSTYPSFVFKFQQFPRVRSISVEPKVRLQGYGYNLFCSHSSHCLEVLV